MGASGKFNVFEADFWLWQENGFQALISWRHLLPTEGRKLALKNYTNFWRLSHAKNYPLHLLINDLNKRTFLEPEVALVLNFWDLIYQLLSSHFEDFLPDFRAFDFRECFEICWFVLRVSHKIWRKLTIGIKKNTSKIHKSFDWDFLSDGDANKSTTVLNFQR